MMYQKDKAGSKNNNFNNYTKSQRAALNKEIRNLIKLGFNENQLIDEVCMKCEFAKEVDPENLQRYIAAQVGEFQGYYFIQKVKHGIILQPSNAKNWQLYNPELKIKEAVLESALSRLVKFDWIAKLLPCEFQYNPHSRNDISTNAYGTALFNTYVPPAWRKDIHYFNEQVTSVTQIPKIYEDFFNHLFAHDKASIEYVIDWLTMAITKRNECYLVTIGKAGVGKGTLGAIMRLLVGAQNYVTVPFKSITKQFNAQLNDRQIIYFDEVQVENQAQSDLLKMLVNDSIEIEMKNVDAKTVKNYASVYLSSNNLNSLKIKADDRRFSLTELTDLPLKDVFPNEFRDSLLTDENIKILGLYLLNRKVDINKMRTPFKSTRTLLAKQSSLKEWEDFLLYSLAFELEGKSIELIELNKLAYQGLDSSKFKITAKALNNLSLTFPGFYTVKRELKGSRKLFVVTFKPLSEQPREQLENLEISENGESL